MAAVNVRAADFSPARLLRLYVSAPFAFWRHDVDVSLEAAARMARFARLAGRRCTFAVMARSEFYNPFSAVGERALFEIADAGHRLVPHVDCRDGDARECVDADAALWHAAFPNLFDLGFVVFHMPSQDVLWRDFTSFGFDHAHAPEWEGRYVSDSRREWTPEKEALLERDGGAGMQVALHPEHWLEG